jgi:hypothetical protein
MHRETNIESIRSLESQIKEHHDEQTIIRLKRSRNSLLNVSALPPEILGDIFHRNVTPRGDFGGLEKGSYNFLLVCHHWFEVASRTHKLWRFWGNNVRDWAKRYLYSPNAPLDLFLEWTWYAGDSLDCAVRNALQERAARGTIRQVHLRTKDPGLLRALLSTLTTNREGLLANNLESLVLWTDKDGMQVDVSDFFAHHRFPKLRRLVITGCKISSWNHLISRTTVLKTLRLTPNKASPTPTASQLFSILASNPHLEELSLSTHMIPSGSHGGPPFPVPLRHLQKLDVAGHPSHLFRFLDQLECPEKMDCLSITTCGCAVLDITRTVGPHLRDYVRRRGKSRNGLDIFLTYDRSITLHVSDVGETDPSIMPAFARTIVTLDEIPGPEELAKLNLDLVTHVPLYEVTSLRSQCPAFMADLCTRLPNLKALNLEAISMSAVFPKPDRNASGVYEEVYPLLQHLSLGRLSLDDRDWTPLTTFLSFRASAGNPIISLTILDSPHMCPEVVEDMRGVVEKVGINWMEVRCPFGRC